MTFTRSDRMIARGAAAIVTVFSVSLMSGAVQASAENDRDGTFQPQLIPKHQRREAK